MTNSNRTDLLNRALQLHDLNVAWQHVAPHVDLQVPLSPDALHSLAARADDHARVRLCVGHSVSGVGSQGLQLWLMPTSARHCCIVRCAITSAAWCPPCR